MFLFRVCNRTFNGKISTKILSNFSLRIPENYGCDKRVMRSAVIFVYTVFPVIANRIKLCIQL